MGKKKKCRYTTYHATAVYFNIYLKGSPGSIPFHEQPHETFHIKENVLFRNGGLPGLIGKSFFLSSLFEPIDWLHLGTLIRLTFPICVLLTNITIRYRFCRFAGGYQL